MRWTFFMFRILRAYAKYRPWLLMEKILIRGCSN